MNVLAEPTVFVQISDAPVIVAWLPDFSHKPQFLPGSVREPALDKLQGSLKCFSRGDQQMKVIRHKDKLVQQISLLLAVVKEASKKSRAILSDWNRLCFWKVDAVMK
jgi:hypothetical protein